MKGEGAEDDQQREGGDEGQRAKRVSSAERGRGVANGPKDLIHGFLIEAAPDDDEPVPAVSVRPSCKLHRGVNDPMGGVNRRWSV